MRAILLILLSAAAFTAGCATAPRAISPPPPLILISMDGFRWDYRDRYPEATPHLRRLAHEGASAKALIPVFPTSTFPNHYSIVTGQYPAHHGIVDNHMFDPTTGEFFHYNTPKSSREPQWWGGEPIWITAVKQGVPSACSYWPGSEAAIKGAHATYWKPYNYYNVTFESRLDELVGWLLLPPAERPAVVTFYFEETNTAGHDFGPDAPQLVAAVKLLDDRLGALRARLEREGIAANFVIVADHGMTAVAPERTLILDDYIDVTTVQVDSDGPVMALRSLKGDLAALERAIAKMPHAKIYRTENLPRHLRHSGNVRIPPLWILPDEGWRAVTRAVADKPRTKGPLRGDHGYDPALESMRAHFIVHGPSFRADGAVIAPVENIHIYNLMCAALHLKPAPNDGDARLVRALLRK